MSSDSDVDQLHAMDSASEEEQSPTAQDEEVDSSDEMEVEEQEGNEDSEEENSEEEDTDKEEEESDSEGEEEKSVPSPKKRIELSKQEPKSPFNKTKNEPRDTVVEKHTPELVKTLFFSFRDLESYDDETLVNIVKDLCETKVEIRRPKKLTNACLVDFKNGSVCLRSFKRLKNVKISGQWLTVRPARPEFLQKLEDDKLEDELATKEAPENVAEAMALTLIVKKIPHDARISEINDLFPNAVDIQIKPARGSTATATALVTMPTLKDATKACKKTYEIGERKLKVSFAEAKKEGKEEDNNKVKAEKSEKMKKKKDEKAKAEKKAKVEDEKNAKVKEVDEEMKEEKNEENKSTQQSVKIITIVRENLDYQNRQRFPYNNQSRYPFTANGTQDTEHTFNKQFNNKQPFNKFRGGKIVHNRNARPYINYPTRGGKFAYSKNIPHTTKFVNHTENVQNE